MIVERDRDTVVVKKANRRVLVLPMGAVADLASAVATRLVTGDKQEVAATDDGRKVLIKQNVSDERCQVFVRGEKGDRNVFTLDTYTEREQFVSDLRMVDTPKDVTPAAPALGGPPASVSASSSAPASLTGLAPSDDDPANLIPSVGGWYLCVDDPHDASIVKSRADGGVAFTHQAGLAPAAPGSNPGALEPGEGDAPQPLNLTEHEEDVAPPTRHQYRSPSQVRSFVECGERYRLEKVERVTSVPGWALVGGRAFHTFVETVETLHHESIGPDPSTLWWPGERAARNIFVNAFRDAIAAEIELQRGKEDGFPDPETWYAAAGKKENAAWWWAKGPDMAHLYTVKNDPSARNWQIMRDPAGKLMLEVPFEIVIGGQYVRGYIDSVTIDREGWVDIVDYKSGSRTPNDGGLQLGTYIQAVETLYPDLARIRGGAHYMARTGELKYYPRREAYREALERRVKVMDMAERAGLYNPNPGINCAACGVKRACVFAA